MREGWEKNDKMMILSNGVDDMKPDHINMVTSWEFKL
jgi:hypothetical protein